MIEIIDLSKSFVLPDASSLEIFDDMSLRIKSGDFVSIMGPSGQGKTTLLNILAGIERQYRWSTQVWWKNLEDMSDSEITRFRGKNISYVFQEYNLIDSLTVEENIELVLDINHIKRRYETDDILKRVWLTGKKKSYPTELSWWEKQRVALARSFVGEARLILADEPTGSLDEKNATRVMELLRDLWREAGCTIIMITHDEKIAQYAELHYTLKNKKLIQS